LPSWGGPAKFWLPSSDCWGYVWNILNPNGRSTFTLTSTNMEACVAL